MQQDQLASIFNQFSIIKDIEMIEPINSGHINDTYLLVCKNQKKYVLQKLNTKVFANYQDVIQNKVTVSKHLNNYYQKIHSSYRTIQFIETKEHEYYTEVDHEIWMLMTFIEESQVFDKAFDNNLVYEAGKLYGNFINATKALDSSKIIETLPNFHSVPWRLKQFDKAFKKATKERISVSEPWLEVISKHRLVMCELWKLKEDKVLPTRITHNDTKLSNILFGYSKPVKGLAVIDLDTVMPGLVHFDFGDSVRSICSSTTEDDTNLESIYLNLDYYDAYCKGFALETKNILTPLEVKYLPLGAQSLIFIMGLRFLTDFLNNDSYYKTNYALHNLDRACNQFTLFNSLLENLDQVKATTQKHFLL